MCCSHTIAHPWKVTREILFPRWVYRFSAFRSVRSSFQRQYTSRAPRFENGIIFRRFIMLPALARVVSGMRKIVITQLSCTLPKPAAAASAVATIMPLSAGWKPTDDRIHEYARWSCDPVRLRISYIYFEPGLRAHPTATKSANWVHSVSAVINLLCSLINDCRIRRSSRFAVIQR